MATLQITDTIGSIAARDYRNAEILRKKGIDFSYDGNRTLEEVSRKTGLTIEQLETALNQVRESEMNADKDFTAWTLESLIDYIINVHHIPAKENAAIIYDLAQKASYQHSVCHPELFQLAAALFFFFDDFLVHLKVEEQILFPAIKELNRMKKDTGKNCPPAFGPVLKSIPILQKEHLASAKDLESFRSLTNGYTLPADAGETQRHLFRKMKEFEDDLFMHVHLENNILFPRGLALAEKLSQKEK